MVIIHDTWGEVAGVEWNEGAEAWDQTISGAYVLRYPNDGWREKPVERWEENVRAFLPGDIYEYPNFPWSEGDRLKCVERYDLSEVWLETPLENLSCLSYANIRSCFAPYSKPCLIIERKVEG